MNFSSLHPGLNDQRSYQDTCADIDNLMAANTDGSTKFTSIATLMAHANEQHVKLLGGDTIHTRTTSSDENQATQTAFDEAFLHNDAGLPTMCGSFRLTTAQRQVIFYLSSPLLSSRIATISISKRSVKMLYNHTVHMEAFHNDDEFETGLSAKAVQRRGAIPQLNVLALGTGTGKTIIALGAAMRVMIEEWAELESNAWDICHARTCDRVSGISTVDIDEVPTCARLTICFVPRNVMNQWVQTFYALRSTWPHPEARRCELWQGIKAATYSAKVAAELPGAPPVLWIVPVDCKAMNVLSDCSSVPIAAVIYDEMTEKMGKRINLPTSPVLGPTIVAQATIDRLDVSMHGNPNHPMRVALFDNTLRSVHPSYIEQHILVRQLGKAQKCMQARACLHVLLVPTFLSRRVTEQAMAKMPTGILAHAVTFRRSTLGGFVGLSDVQASTLGEALRHIFKVHVDARLPTPLFRLLQSQKTQDQLDPETLLGALRAVDMGTYTKDQCNCALRLSNQIQEIVGGKASCAICMCTQKELDEENLACRGDGPQPDEGASVARTATTTSIGSSGSNGSDTNIPACLPSSRADNKLVFASCCTGIFCIRCMKKAKRSRPECSLCRQIAKHTVLLPDGAPDAAAARGKKRTTDKMLSGGDNGHRQQDALFAPCNGDESMVHEAGGCAFERRLRDMSSEDRRMPAAQAAAHVMLAAVDELAHGHGARILLFFDMASAGSDAHGNGPRNPDYLVRTHLQQVLPEAQVFNLEKMSTNTRQSKIALSAYCDPNLRDPVVLLCTTSEDSKSIAGLDLVNTHVTIICGRMQDSIRLQLIGRVLRMTSVEHFQTRPAHVVNLVSE